MTSSDLDTDVAAPAASGRLLWDRFVDHAQRSPQRVAVQEDGQACNYRSLHLQVQQFAGWLQKIGVSPGERVLIVLPNSLEYVISYLASQRVSAVAVGVRTGAGPDQIAKIITDARPTAVVFHPAMTRRIEQAFMQLNERRIRLPIYLIYTGAPAAAVGLADSRILPFSFASAAECLTRPSPSRDVLAQIVYTRTPTGELKGAMLTHGNIAANCQSILATLDLHHTDSTLALPPFPEAYGNSILFTHLAAGATLVMASRRRPGETLEDHVKSQRPSGCAGTLPFCRLLLAAARQSPKRFQSLRTVLCDGPGLSHPEARQLQSLMPGARLFFTYTRAEAAAWLAAMPPADHVRKPASLGRPLDGIELEIVTSSGRAASPGETGEIVARGQNIMQGYWNDVLTSRSVLTPRGLRTGDVGSMDEEGFLYLSGRRPETDMRFDRV